MKEQAPVEKKKRGIKGAPNHSKAFKKGQSGNPNGRPKGRVSGFSMVQAREIAGTGYTPLQFLTAIYRRDEAALKELKVDLKMITVERRQRAAEAVAPYVHRKMPIGIDNGKGGPIGFYTAEELMQLDDKELDVLTKVMGKLAVLGGHPGEVYDVEPTKVAHK